MLFNPWLGGGIRGFDTFPKGISPKVNVIERLEFELVYFEHAVKPFSHYARETLDQFFFALFLSLFLSFFLSLSIYLCMHLFWFELFV